MNALCARELQTTLQERNVHSFHLKANLFSYFSNMFDAGLMDIPKAFGWSLNDLILRSLVELELLLLSLLLLLLLLLLLF